MHLAVANVGAVANPIIPIYRESEVSYILGDSDAKCVVVPAEYRGFDYPEMIAELAPDLPALETVVTVGGEADVHESVDTRTYDDMAATSAEGYDRPEMGADDIHALL